MADACSDSERHININATFRTALSDKTSRLRPRHVVPKPRQTHEPEGLVEVREWIAAALASSGLDVSAPAACLQSDRAAGRQRACSADDRSRAPAHSRGDGGRNSFIALPGPATASSGSRPDLAVTTPTSQPIARGSQIPIAPARRTVVSMPARGFLPRGLSDARPPRATHCQVTGRRLIALNDSRPSRPRLGTGGFDPRTRANSYDRAGIRNPSPKRSNAHEFRTG